MGTPKEITTSEVRWSVDRTRVLSDIFTRIKVSKITFPCKDEVAGMLEELWHEMVEYNAHDRNMRYYCPPGHHDDTLHAMAYSLAVSSYIMSKK